MIAKALLDDSAVIVYVIIDNHKSAFFMGKISLLSINLKKMEGYEEFIEILQSY